MWLHAATANIDRVCSDDPSEHAEPVKHLVRWSVPGGGVWIREVDHVPRSGRISTEKGCAQVVAAKTHVDDSDTGTSADSLANVMA